MYLDHFGLKELPFAITADASFAFNARSHERVLRAIRTGLENGEALIKITGEVGAGKTFLCRRFLAGLGPEFLTAYVAYADLDADGLLQALAKGFHIALEGGLGRHAVIEALQRALLECSAAGKTLVLCLDEAHTLRTEALDALRLLSDMESGKEKLLHIVLLGQPELDEKLGADSARQIRQRIATQCHLGTLARDELPFYLARRLSAAGYSGPPLFAAEAVSALARASRGLPRLLNLLAHKSMLHAAAASRLQVECDDVRAAREETLDAMRRPRKLPGQARWQLPWPLPRFVGVGAAAGATLAALVVAVALWRHGAVAAASDPARASAPESGAGNVLAAFAPVPEPTSVPALKPASGSAHGPGSAPALKPASALKAAPALKPGSTPKPASAPASASAAKPAAAPALHSAAAAAPALHPAAAAAALDAASVHEVAVAVAGAPALSAPAASPMERQGDPPAAAETAVSRDRAATAYRDAYAAMNQGHVEEAIEGMQRVLRSDPDYAPARRALSQLLIDQHRLAEARALLVEGQNRDPSQWQLALALARIQVDWGQLEAAADTLRRSALFGANPEYRGFRAGVLARLGRHEEAVAEYGAALRSVPGSGVWWMGMGLSLEAIGKAPEAHDAFQLARNTGSLTPELNAFVEAKLKTASAAPR